MVLKKNKRQRNDEAKKDFGAKKMEFWQGFKILFRQSLFMVEIVELVISGLVSGEKQKVDEAKKLVSNTMSQHYKESFPRNGEATKKICLLRDEFIKLCESNNPKERLTGLRGLNWISISDPFDEKIGVLNDILFKSIIDDNGNIRLAAANAFGYIRPAPFGSKKLTGSSYAQLYLDIIRLLDKQKDKKKKKSIENLLGKLWCPHLDTILEKQGYSKVEK